MINNTKRRMAVALTGLWIGLAMALPASTARAQGAGALAVVVNPAVGVTELDQKQLKRIYTGRLKSLQGVVIVPLELPRKAPERVRFSELLLGKTVDEVERAYMKRALSGKGQPPKQMTSNQEVLDYVAANPGAIGYVSKSAADGSSAVQSFDLAAVLGTP